MSGSLHLGSLMMKQLFFYFVVSIFCYAHAGEDSLSEIYLGSRENDPDSIVENVSTIHGDYTEVEVDLTVASPDSLALSRFYSSRDTLHIASLGGWRFSPHCFLTMQKDPKAKSFSSDEGIFERVLVYAGNPDGTIFIYSGWKNISHPSNLIRFKISTEKCVGIANTAKRDIGAWTNPKNNELNYDPQNDSFELLLCTEGKRSYVKSRSGNFYTITHEILPSGNKIFYEFDDKNRITLIKQTNADEKKELAWIKIQYQNGMLLETSDGKTVLYQFQKDSLGNELLTNVTRSDKPSLNYQYQVVDQHAFLVKKSLPDGCFVQIDYDFEENKVKSVALSSGDGEKSTTRFIYGPNSTEVDGPGHRKAVYRFNEDFHLLAIEQYLDGSSYRIQKKSWGEKNDADNLISASITDGNGKIFYHKCFVYDKANKGNIVEEREYGDISGNGAIALVMGENGFVSNQEGNVKKYSYFSGETTYGCFQRDAKGCGIKYWYKKGTNLLVKKLVLTRGSLDSEDENYHSGIKQRYFYTYNEDAALVRVIVDDGTDGNPENIYNILERKITHIFPKQQIPSLGTPEIIEQKYYSLENESEFLINRTINHFDAQGNISAQEIYDANNTHRYTLKKQYEHGLLVLETDPMGNETRYSYDTNRNLKSEIHPSTGISIEYRYDIRNHLVHTIEKDLKGKQFETQIDYDEAGYKNREKDRFGNETLYVNDALGRPIRIIYPETSNGFHSSIKTTYTYAYDLFDHPISVTGPQGRTLTKSYTVQGNLAEVKYPDGTKEVFRYDSSGNLHHHYCRNGLLEVFEYDYIGRLNNVKYYEKGSNSSGDPFKEISSQYSAFHKTSETDARNNITTYTYDGCGRPCRLIKENQTIEFSYDPLGREQSIKKWTSSKDFTLEVKDYDLLDRIIEERTENSSGEILIRKRFVYNDAGKLAQIIGYPQNHETILMQYEHDGLGRLCKATNATGNVSQIIYDDAYTSDWGQKGSKRTVVDSLGNRTDEIFDSDDHLIQVCKKNKSGKLLSCQDISYDCFGNKKLEKSAVIAADGPSGNHEIEYSYNQNDQLESIALGKGSPEEKVTRFEYNSHGELAKKYNPGEQPPISYQYDNRGNLEIISYKESEKKIETRLYYDKNKNLTSMNQDGFSIDYDYDENDLLTSETINDEFGEYQISRTYDGEGKIQTFTFPDGSYVKYSYEGPLVRTISRFSKDKKKLYTYTVSSRDQMGNILEEILPLNLGIRTQFWNKTGNRAALTTDFFQDKVLEYDSLGHIKKRKISFEETPCTIEYDSNVLLQLISEKGPINHEYSYDSIGNRLKKDRSTYKVNILNELMEAEGNIYTFHPNGSIATKVVQGNTWTYRMNPLNQVISIQDADQNRVIFTYNLTGKRLSKHIDAKGKKSKILRFFYIDDTEIGCVNEKGMIIELKIPSDPNNPESSAIAIEVKNEIYVPIYDLQENIVCLLDPIKHKVVESYCYSVYGEEEITNESGKILSQSSIGNPWRYRGKRVDEEVGLIYFGYRYYDSEIGRWISPDPIGTIDGPNLYTFAHNNPMKYIDSFGLYSKLDENCGCTLHSHPGWFNAPINCVCICGRDESSEESASRDCTKKGGNIKSALGGISHGVVDFVIGSLHDLQTASVYIGSSEQEMSLQERMQIIETVELSQMQQSSCVKSHVLNLFSIDESDAVYQSFRSKTTMGLEIASLVAGGYGAVKGVVAFTKLAKMPVQITKVAALSTKPLKSRNGFLGCKGFELKNASYQPLRNKPTNIQGRPYSGHALDQMQNRGLTPSVINEVMQRGSYSVGKNPGTMAYYDSVNDVTVIVNTEGRVITTFYGEINQ